MPILSYQCHSCGLSQKKRTPKALESVTCVCGSLALPAEVGEVSVGFTTSVVNKQGLVKAQDSGMESFDLNYDRVIGEDAAEKWDVIYHRKRDKIDLLESSKGTSMKDVMRLPDGTYAVKPNDSVAFREERLRRIKLSQTPYKSQE